MIKVNEYFEGKVKSLGAEVDGQRFTVGVIEPGEYTFPTDYEEHITVTLGKMEVQLPDQNWKTLLKGETVVAPPKTNLKIKVEKPVSYICLYK